MDKVLKPLTIEEKEIILQLNKDGYNTVYISNQIGRNNSTVGRFLKRKYLDKLWFRSILNNRKTFAIVF